MGVFQKEQQDRIDRYERFILLREGQHEKAFQNIINKYGHAYKTDAKMGMSSRFIPVNLPKEITRISADLMFDEKPIIKTEENQEFIDTVWEELELGRILYESVDYCSARGDAVLRVRIEVNEIKVEAIDPSMYVPVYDDGIQQGRPDAQEIWHQVKIKRGLDEVPCALIENYRAGTLTYRLWDGKQEVPIEEYYPDLATPVELGLDKYDQMIIHVKNSGTPTDYWGTSDYADIEGLIYEIDNRTSRIAAILDKHSSPILKVPKGVVEEMKQGKPLDLIEYFAQNGDVKIEYIAWDGQLAPAFQHLDICIDQMLVIANIAPSLLGRDQKGGSGESGRALKFRLIRTLSMKHRKEMYWGSAIRQLLWTIQKLSSVNGYTVSGMKSLAPEMPTVQFKDTLIMDAIEKLDTIDRQLQMGLITQQEAIQEFHELEESVAEERLAKIKEEKKQQTAFTMPELTDL